MESRKAHISFVQTGVKALTKKLKQSCGRENPLGFEALGVYLAT
jgi:hypothetical protein